jgi:hypothetical protein
MFVLPSPRPGSSHRVVPGGALPSERASPGFSKPSRAPHQHSHAQDPRKNGHATMAECAGWQFGPQAKENRTRRSARRVSQHVLQRRKCLPDPWPSPKQSVRFCQSVLSPWHSQSRIAEAGWAAGGGGPAESRSQVWFHDQRKRAGRAEMLLDKWGEMADSRVSGPVVGDFHFAA